MPAKVIEKSYNSKVLKYKFETSFPALLRFYSQEPEKMSAVGRI